MPPGDDAPATPFPPGTVAAFFSPREKARRALWYMVAATLFRCSFRRADGWRAMLLRAFGAKVGARCLIRRSAWIEIPWNVTIGDDVMLGEHCIIYSLGHITIGDRAVISQYSHLCGGSHDYRTRGMMLLRVPVTIGADAWIAADAFVGPGVTVGEGTIVGARSSVFSNLPAWKICVGNPARVLKDRVPLDPEGTP
ncbi:MAG: WcaF family extracellular polysaccharide biosynthesis acetyltransferase [Phycisphaerales bacterium]|jgi:putative colanic acid biosynthesis acetyltransferase WcaF